MQVRDERLGTNNRRAILHPSSFILHPSSFILHPSSFPAPMPLKLHHDEQPTLNLTAMLDIMFLLLIFFVLNTKFLDDERQINLQVPQVNGQNKLAAADQQKTINVYKDG